MGSGNWDPDLYKKAVGGKDAFAYSNDLDSIPVAKRKAAPELDPKGLKIRESRDSAEHPNSNTIAIALDVTGSMTRVVVEIRDGLGKLMGMLINQHIISDPQLMFMAVGDVVDGDRVPFQISQFESDLRINGQLSKIYLEGAGGYFGRESYELAFYALALHTDLDCLNKRGRKGYSFFIGDELPYEHVTAQAAKKVFGVDIGQDISTADIVGEVKKKFRTFFIIPQGSTGANDSSTREFWESLMGGRRYVLCPSAEAVCETIAVAIGLSEGAFTLDAGVALVEKISGKAVAMDVKRTLEYFAGRLLQEAGDNHSSGGKKDKKQKKSKKEPVVDETEDKKQKNPWQL